jgi:DNA repair exonuclease SbcCD nuclease subunit
MTDSARSRFPAPRRDVTVVHSSDIHVDHGTEPRPFGSDGVGALRAVLEAARRVGADVTLLAGDTFEHNRLPADLLARAAAVLEEAGMQVVMLPGNHDPLTPDSVFRRGALADLPNVHVLGITHEQAVLFPELQLEIWGHAHHDYVDSDPLRLPRPRSSFWQIAVAHGHYDPIPDRSTRVRPSWLFGDAEIAATGADYVALGHWNRAIRVGGGPVAAYYSGSPDYSGTVNLVCLGAGGEVTVSRERLSGPESE